MAEIDPRTEYPLPPWAQNLDAVQADLTNRAAAGDQGPAIQAIQAAIQAAIASYEAVSNTGDTAVIAALAPSLTAQLDAARAQIAALPPDLPPAAQATADALDAQAQTATSAAETLITANGP